MRPTPRPELRIHLESDFLLPIPRDLWPEGLERNGRENVWLSKHFMVQRFAPTRGFIRLSINRPMLGEDGSWLAEITWDELMVCKRQVGFADHDAIEVFPRDRDVVHVANMRHLWVLPNRGPELLPIVWRRKPTRV